MPMVTSQRRLGWSPWLRPWSWPWSWPCRGRDRRRDRASCRGRRRGRGRGRGARPARGGGRAGGHGVRARGAVGVLVVGMVVVAVGQPAPAGEASQQEGGAGDGQQHAAGGRQPGEETVGGEGLRQPQHAAQHQHAGGVGGGDRAADRQHLASGAAATHDRRRHERLAVARGEAVEAAQHHRDAQRQGAGSHAELAPAHDAREGLGQRVAPSCLRFGRRVELARRRDVARSARASLGAGRELPRRGRPLGVGGQPLADRHRRHVGARQRHAVAVERDLPPAEAVAQVGVGEGEPRPRRRGPPRPAASTPAAGWGGRPGRGGS